MSAGKALVALIVMVPVVGLFIAAGVADHLFIGFVFILYWAGIKATAPAEFVPALLGALGGLGLTYLVHVLPGALGLPGIVLVGVAIAVSVYLLVRRQATVVINDAFMLLLTLGTCLAFRTDADYAAAATALVLAALYSGGLLLLVTLAARRSGRAASGASADGSARPL